MGGEWDRLTSETCRFAQAFQDYLVVEDSAEALVVSKT